MWLQILASRDPNMCRRLPDISLTFKQSGPLYLLTLPPPFPLALVVLPVVAGALLLLVVAGATPSDEHCGLTFCLTSISFRGLFLLVTLPKRVLSILQQRRRWAAKGWSIEFDDLSVQAKPPCVTSSRICLKTINLWSRPDS